MSVSKEYPKGTDFGNQRNLSHYLVILKAVTNNTHKIIFKIIKQISLSKKYQYQICKISAFKKYHKFKI